MMRNYNIFISAAALLTTVCYLWHKIKKQSYKSDENPDHFLICDNIEKDYAVELSNNEISDEDYNLLDVDNETDKIIEMDDSVFQNVEICEMNNKLIEEITVECQEFNDRRGTQGSLVDNLSTDKDCFDVINNEICCLTETVCSSKLSSESDQAHRFNEHIQKLATNIVEAILKSLITVDAENIAPSNDTDNFVIVNSPSGDSLNKFNNEESVARAYNVKSEVTFTRMIPVGISGRLIGKKGKFKNELLVKYGAKLIIYNHPWDYCKQVMSITCDSALQSELERWADDRLAHINKSSIHTTVSNPEWLKPMIPLGKMVPVHVIDMPTIQHLKLRIYDPVMIRAYNTMQTQINADYTTTDFDHCLLPRPVSIGCICIAMITPAHFVRAQIIHIYDQIAVVYLYDIGKTHQTYLCYLFKIREKYMRVPFQVIPARLSHAVINNQNTCTSSIIHKRFLCDQQSSRPTLVRAFFPRMYSCCEPCVHIYVSRDVINGGVTCSNECVDLLELLVSIDVCSMVRETIECSMQASLNESHYKYFISDNKSSKDIKKKSTHHTQSIVTPAYFEPCNIKFYEEFINYQYENENN